MKFTKPEQNRINKLTELLKGDVTLNYSSSMAQYKRKYASKGKMIKGKWVRWDERTNKPYTKEAARTFINKELYNTETPREDLKYLEAKKDFILKSQGTGATSYRDPFQESISRKLVIDDKNKYSSVYQKQQAARFNKDRLNLINLRKKTSFYRLDKAYQAGEVEREEYEWGPEGQPGSSLKINKSLTDQDKDISRTHQEIGLNSNNNNKSSKAGTENLKTDPMGIREQELLKTETLKGELRALNKLNMGRRGQRGGNLTLAIMRKEQELHNRINPGKPFPKLTGRDALNVGYATGQEARDYARTNRARLGFGG